MKNYDDSKRKNMSVEYSDDFLEELLMSLGNVKVEVARVGEETCNDYLRDALACNEVELCMENKIAADPVEQVLACVGILNEREADPVFSPSVGLITRVGECQTFYVGEKRVEQFNVPVIGAEKLTQRIVNNSCIFSPDEIVGNCDRDNFIIGARPKIDGVQAIVFSVVDEDAKETFIYWDDEEIREVETCKIGLFEKVGDVLFCLSSKSSDYGSLTLRLKDREYVYRDHEYEVLTHEFLKSLEVEGNDGAILNIDGFDYKCPRFKVITLKYDGVVLKDKSGKLYEYDMSDKVRGFYDFRIDGQEIVYDRIRTDKIEADSTAVVDVISNHLIVTSELVSNLVMRRERKKLLWDDVLPIVYIDSVPMKRQVINDMIKSSRIGLVYKKQVSSRRDKDFFSFMGNNFTFSRCANRKSDFYFLAGTAHPRYVRKKETRCKIRAGRFVISNEWFIGCRAYVIKRKKFVAAFWKEVPGLGYKYVVYLKKI